MGYTVDPDVKANAELTERHLHALPPCCHVPVTIQEKGVHCTDYSREGKAIQANNTCSQNGRPALWASGPDPEMQFANLLSRQSFYCGGVLAYKVCFGAEETASLVEIGFMPHLCPFWVGRRRFRHAVYAEISGVRRLHPRSR